MERIPVQEESKEPVEEEPQIPFRLQYEIEAIHGKYTIRRPSGTVGSTHFMLLASCLPSSYDTDGTPLVSPRDEERQTAAYQKWVPTVLKHIIISYPVIDGVQVTYDTMPPEDQWALFQAVGSLMKSSTGPKPFRIILPKTQGADNNPM